MTAVVLASLLAASSSNFHFVAPKGWTDLQTATAEQKARLPDSVKDDVERVKGGFYAVDLSHLDENLVATYSAKALPGAADLSKERLGPLEQGAKKLAAIKGEELEPVGSDYFEKYGAKAIRIRFNRPFRSDELDFYMVTRNGETAFLTFIAPLERYEEYAPLFAATVDALMAARPSPVAYGQVRLLIAVGVIVLFGAFAFLYFGRSRKRR